MRTAGKPASPMRQCRVEADHRLRMSRIESPSPARRRDGGLRQRKDRKDLGRDRTQPTVLEMWRKSTEETAKMEGLENSLQGGPSLSNRRESGKHPTEEISKTAEQMLRGQPD